MMFSVPQFIDVEDKIAGPLTWRQLLWMIGMGAVLLLMFSVFDAQLFFVIAIPVVMLFIALAFYRPNGIPLAIFIFHSILFLFRPKIAVWERPVRVQAIPKKETAAPVVPVVRQQPLTQERLSELARMVDRHSK